MTTALILAGDRGEGDPLAGSENVELKAFIDLHGTPMLDYVSDTLNSSENINRIIICLPKDTDLNHSAPQTFALIAEGKAECIDQADGPVESIIKALDHIHGSPELLVTTADHPLLSVETLQTFIDQAQDGVSVGMVPLDLVMSKFPQSKRTALKFSDGKFSGANLFYFKGREAGNILIFWQSLQKYRKKPISMAARIGFGSLIAYLFGKLSLKSAFKAISKRANVTVQSIILNDPYAAVDVDKPADLELVREILSDKKKKI